MKSLTWYPGTILPYASLWHTLVRATWLNDLRGGEIRDLVAGKRRRDDASRRQGQESFNLRLVAAALGEPRRAFSRFAVLSQFPPCLFRAHIADGLRWCPACLDAGFHTLLLSIRLVTRCPIHVAPLVDACPGCGERFGMPLGGLAVRPKACQCGRTQLADLGAVRQPGLRREDVEPWAPVARWVRQIESVCCSASPDGAPSLQIQLALTARWCRDLGIDYPECFEAEPTLWADADEPGRWSTYRARSGDLSGARPRTPNGPLSAPPQHCVYRAMGRHLRRHGLPHPDRWIAELIDTVDPATFAMKMAVRPKARTAFIEMLWSRLLEPHAYLRRWPNRPALSDLSPLGGTPIDLERGVEQLQLIGPSISGQAKRWLGYHATAMAARLAWDSALRRTQGSIDNRWADWSRGGDALVGRIAWSARPRGKGWQFVGYLRDVEAQPFGSSAPTKKQRHDALAQARLEPRRHLETLADCDCLGWDRRAGWHVCSGARPDDDDVRLVRVLHVGTRTNCWLFRSNGRFVARLANGVVQAAGDSPREALSGLRSAVVQYRRTYAANHAEAVRRCVSLAPLSPTKAQLARNAVEMHSVSRRSDGFWTTSSGGMAIAHRSFLLAHDGADVPQRLV